MVINVIYIVGNPSFEAEYNTPVGANCHGPKSPPVSLKRMQVETRKVHVSYREGSIEAGKNVSQLRRVFCNDTLAFVVLIQSPQALVANRLDHD